MNKKINILFTSSGRRISLIKKFKEAIRTCGKEGNIITADISKYAPTAYISDKHYIVPRVTDDKYLKNLLTICEKEGISLVIPLIDTELNLLSENVEIFEEINVKVLVSSKELNQISSDKMETYKFFQKNNIDTPKTYTNEELETANFNFPLLLKPRSGSSSIGVTKINNEKELYFFKEYIHNPLVQEYITGDEYTVDVMVDFEGNIKSIVPRLRLETRAGEVSKGITKKDIRIIQAVEDVIKKLPEPVGCITIQCFKEKNGGIKFIEINPRFGGGIPLSIEAGANFPLWTIEMATGELFKEPTYEWKDNLLMLRFDEGIFAVESYGN